jgi:hypothetical protein
MKALIVPLLIVAAIVATWLLHNMVDDSFSTRPAARWSYDPTK